MTAHWRIAATLATTLVWCVLIFQDDRWSLVGFLVYAACFTVVPERPGIGIALAALVSGWWAIAQLAGTSPAWTAAIPAGVLLGGATLSLLLHRLSRLTERQADLIASLRSTTTELAVAERINGRLEERARFAGEIHDTVAQGLTSIVLLSRSAHRDHGDDDRLGTIEETAQEGLEAARRLITAATPVELEQSSLPEAIARELAQLASQNHTNFRVIGDVRALPPTHELVVLRSAQEGLRNIAKHASATSVGLTLTYLDGAVRLDVRDDGISFEPDAAESPGHGGGQGLRALDLRARSVGGTLHIQSDRGRGTVLSVTLPAGAR